MATTTASVWAKPGAWALEAEESEALEQMKQEQRQQQEEAAAAAATDEAALADFPSLSMAAAAKTSRKKKGQTFSLSEFNTGKVVTHGAGKSRGSESVGLTPDELLMLPTGPRQRSPEELERSKIGGGFRSYGREGFSRDGGAGGDRGYGNGAGRQGGGAGGPREFTPSRADEIDDWGAGKRPLPERRERGFFESQSKADESDNWSSNKSRSASSGGGFGGYKEREGRSRPWSEMLGGVAGSNSWGRKAEDSNVGGLGAASDSWGRKTEDINGSGMGAGGRPRLVLQPRTLPLSGKSDQPAQSTGVQKTKGSNPFGEARPREEVLAEKGQDWKKIDEKLEATKVKEVDPAPRLERNDGSFGRRDFGNGRVSSHDDRTGRAWRKLDSTDSPGRVTRSDDVEKSESNDEVDGAPSN